MNFAFAVNLTAIASYCFSQKYILHTVKGGVGPVDISFGHPLKIIPKVLFFKDFKKV